MNFILKKITVPSSTLAGVQRSANVLTHKPDYINHDRNSFLHPAAGRHLLRTQNVAAEAAERLNQILSTKKNARPPDTNPAGAICLLDWRFNFQAILK